MQTQTSDQFNKWLDEEIDSLNYDGRQMEQFKEDLKEAIRQHLLDEFLESIERFPYPKKQSLNY